MFACQVIEWPAELLKLIYKIRSYITVILSSKKSCLDKFYNSLLVRV